MKPLAILLALTGAAALYAQQPADPFIKGNVPASPATPADAGEAGDLQTRVFHVPVDFLSRGKGVKIEAAAADPFAAPPAPTAGPGPARLILESLGVSFATVGAAADLERGSGRLIVKHTPAHLDLVQQLVADMGGGTGETLPAEALARMEIFSLPHTLARKVRRQFPKSADLYAWLDAELQKPQSEVKLDHLSALKLRGGQRSKVEQLDEYPWPTEFDPPQIPQTFTVGVPVSGSSTTTTTINNPPQTPPIPVPPNPAPPAPPAPAPGAKGDAGQPGATAQPPPPPPGSIPVGRIGPPWPYTPTTPTAMQIRNLGWTAEMEMTLGEDGETVDILIAPEMARLTGLTRSPSGEIEQPNFETARLSVQVIAKMGRPQYVGTLSRPPATGVENGNTENRVRLLFITPVKPAPEIPPPAPPATTVQAGVVHFDCFSLETGAARRAMLQNPKEQALFRWLDGAAEKPDSGVVMEQTHTLQVRGGQRSKVEEIDEYPFPTEFDPPQIPQTIGMLPDSAPTPAGEGRVFPAVPRSPTTPNSFQFRNLGWTSEVELTFSENGWLVDLNLAPQYVRLVGSLAWGADRELVQPVFETQKMQGQVSAVINQPTLVSTFSPPLNTGVPGGNTKDRVWFLFVTVAKAE